MMAKWGSFNIEDLVRVEKKILVLVAMVIFIMLLGTATFILLENQTPGEALYSTFSSAVGHGFEYQNRMTVIITAFMMVMEWACLWIAFDTVVSFISEGKVKEIVGGMKMKKKVDGMSEHCILCGYGRVGSEIARALHASKKDLVILEKDSHMAREALNKGYMVMEGDVLSEETLKSAGIQRAKTLIAAMGSDADNVFVALTAKELNPHIRIIARAERTESVKKLKQAGASEVVMPSAIGGKAMADAVIRI